MYRHFLLALVLALLVGCSARGVGGSYVGELPQGSAVGAIAEDTSAWLAQEFPPGLTTLHLLTPKGSQDFTGLFEDSLRRKGFVVTQESGSEGLSVAYILDKLDDEAWYLQVKIDGNKAVSRVYGADGKPVAGRSSTALEKGALARASEKASETADTIGTEIREIF